MTSPSTAAPILAVVLLSVVALLGTYAGGYFWQGQPRRILLNNATFAIDRSYPVAWQATIFRPAGKLEAWWMGYRVDVWSRSEWRVELSPDSFSR